MDSHHLDTTPVCDSSLFRVHIFGYLMQIWSVVWRFCLGVWGFMISAPFFLFYYIGCVSSWAGSSLTWKKPCLWVHQLHGWIHSSSAHILKNRQPGANDTCSLLSCADLISWKQKWLMKSSLNMCNCMKWAWLSSRFISNYDCWSHP